MDQGLSRGRIANHFEGALHITVPLATCQEVCLPASYQWFFLFQGSFIRPHLNIIKIGSLYFLVKVTFMNEIWLEIGTQCLSFGCNWWCLWRFLPRHQLRSMSQGTCAYLLFRKLQLFSASSKPGQSCEVLPLPKLVVIQLVLVDLVGSFKKLAKAVPSRMLPALFQKDDLNPDNRISFVDEATNQFCYLTVFIPKIIGHHLCKYLMRLTAESLSCPPEKQQIKTIRNKNIMKPNSTRSPPQNTKKTNPNPSSRVHRLGKHLSRAARAQAFEDFKDEDVTSGEPLELRWEKTRKRPGGGFCSVCVCFFPGCCFFFSRLLGILLALFFLKTG